MSTEYELYLEGVTNLQSFANELYQNLCSIDKEVESPRSIDSENIEIGCWFAGISIHRLKGPKLNVLRKVYNIAPGIRVSLQTYNDSLGYPRPQEYLMQLVNIYLHVDDRDLMLEFNGEFMIVLRKNGILQINHAFDDGTRFPFHILTVPYEIVHVPVS